MIPGQPADDAVGLGHLQTDAVRAQIVEKRPVSDGDAVREAGRAARILEISDIVAGRRRKLARGGLDLGERFPGARLDACLVGGALAEVRELFGIEEQRRVGALQLDPELIDIGFAPAEAGRQGQRHRPGAGINRAEEACGELDAGFGNQRDTVAGLDPERDEAARLDQRIVAQLRERIGQGQRAARVMEIEPAPALAA